MKIFGQKHLKYWSPSSIMFVNDSSRLWHMAQYFFCHMAYFGKKNFKFLVAR
jgi:hypothetical protein